MQIFPNFLEVLLRTFREMPVLRKKSEVFTNFLRKLILFSIFAVFFILEGRLPQ